ncbi:MAG: aminotransferase class I/II-fold pyridoxal phosphate-dependent enzyme [Candidatus Synoicihabitans palmerolidicus]|nr:aminotransferase class I/II-fold pyridoxal phosphate-dependent enzyme [Candidatus Synoicihabitans palmerolidicus]
MPQLLENTKRSKETDWTQWPELRALARRKDALAGMVESNPYFEGSEPKRGGRSVLGGKELIGYSSYDYLGLARDSRVIGALEEAARRWGISANASRIAAGERPVHGELEDEIATFLGVESCLTMVGGYGTNVAVIGYLLGPDDLLLHDQLAHECILSGGRLSGKKCGCSSITIRRIWSDYWNSGGRRCDAS